MIVSARDDVIAVPRRKRGPVKAVKYSVPGSDVVSAVPPQKKTFNNSHNIAKPLIFDPKLKGDYVPLKCDQLNSHAYGASLFNAEEPLILKKLDVPRNKSTGFTYDLPMREDVEVPFEEGLNYEKGIRPSAGPRRLKAQVYLPEPTNPFPDRPGGVGAKRTIEKMTYSVGKLALEQLSR